MVTKRIIYSEHLRYRLKTRKIDYELPGKVFSKAQDSFSDTITGSKIIIGIAEYAGKIRELAVIFKEKDDFIQLITVHPLRAGEKEKRIQSGRWVKDERT